MRCTLPTHVDDLTGVYALNRLHQRNVVFHPVPLDMDNNDSESDLFEVVLVFKTLVDRDQNVTLALSLGDQLGVPEGTPFGFGDGQTS